MDNIQINDEFYVTLLSDSSMNYYPENTLSAFANKLNKQVILNSKWKVGISEIYINDFIPNIYGENPEKRITIHIGGTENSFVSIGTTYIPYRTNQINCDWKSFVLPALIRNIEPFPGYTKKECERQLIWQIYDFISKDSSYIKSENAASYTGELITICVSNPKVEIKLRTQGSFTIDFFIKECFNQILQKVSDFKKHKNRIVELYKSYLETLYLIPVINSDMIFVYTDIIEPHIVGDNTLRCLRTMTVKNVYENNSIEFNNIQYFPVEKKGFDNISILLCDKYGYKINFSISRIPTKVVLHFKKV